MNNFIGSFNFTPEFHDVWRLREALHESEYRYRKLLDAVTDYIYFVQIENGMPAKTIHGPGCSAVTGYQPEDYEANPMLWYSMIHPSDKDYVGAHINSVLSGSPVSCIEHRIIDKENSIRWIRHTPVQHFDDKGALISYVGLVADITEQRNLKEQLFQSQKMESIGRLAGGLAHDFNNYLGSVMGLAELTQMKIGDSHPCYDNLSQIITTSKKAANLTRQLLAFSSRQTIEQRAVNLNNAITDFTKILKPLIGADITIELDLAKDLSCVMADLTKMEQIIINLAVNARDAIDGPGTITIQTCNEELDDKMSMSLKLPAGQYVTMTFSDTGSGIPDDVLPHIFEPFFTTKVQGKGTGLGLSTVYGIVEQHSGKIRAFSEQDKGSRFVIFLPAVEQENLADEKTAQARTPNALPGETIMIVDDTDIVRRTTADILRSFGYTAIECSGGEEALEVCRSMQKVPGLVITDVSMPNMCGREFAVRIKKLWSDVKIMYMSGKCDDTPDGGVALQENINFVRKPFLSADLLRLVNKMLHE